MDHDIKEIKILRKKLEITQNELAKKSGVSQSLIAKIESNNIDPAYSSIKKIFLALNSLSKKKSLKAKDIMQKKIITINQDKSITDAIVLMKKYKISQIPVLKNDIPIGVISETTIINSLIEEKTSNLIKNNMDAAPPILTIDTDINAISSLLKFFQMVIITNKGQLTGIVTKADILEHMYK